MWTKDKWLKCDCFHDIGGNFKQEGLNLSNY